MQFFGLKTDAIKLFPIYNLWWSFPHKLNYDHQRIIKKKKHLFALCTKSILFFPVQFFATNTNGGVQISIVSIIYSIGRYTKYFLIRFYYHLGTYLPYSGGYNSNKNSPKDRWRQAGGRS